MRQSLRLFFSALHNMIDSRKLVQYEKKLSSPNTLYAIIYCGIYEHNVSLIDFFLLLFIV